MLVALRALAPEDIPAVVEGCADWEELAAHGPPYWRPRSSAELSRKIAATSGPTLASEYNFVLDRDGVLVGECSLHTIDWRNRVGQVGICIWRPSNRGRGYGRSGATAVISWAEQHLDLARLEAWILSQNAASLRLFDSLGFDSEAVLRGRYVQAGARHDVHVLGRLAPTAGQVASGAPTSADHGGRRR